MKKYGILLGLLCLLSPIAQAQTVTVKLDVPYGVPSLDGNGFITAPSRGQIDSATVNGVPLSYIIPQIESKESQNSAIFIPLKAINNANGVLGLDSTGNISRPLVFNSTVTLTKVVFSHLASGSQATQGMVSYCSDCFSTARDGQSTTNGLLTSYNGTQWVDGLGNPLGNYYQ